MAKEKIATINKRKFDRFMHLYKAGHYKSLRLGQAFYNEFDLYKMSNQTELHNLYAKDGKHASNLIQELFEFA